MAEQQKPVEIADEKKVPAEQARQAAQTDSQEKTVDSNSPRTRSPAEQVKVWEEEGGSPPKTIAATRSVKPKVEPKAGAMGTGKD